MKKATRRFLYALGAMLLLLGYMLYESIRRSEAAIATHERRIAEDIAGFRRSYGLRRRDALLWADRALDLIKETPKGRPSFFFSSSNLRTLRAALEQEPFFPYEDPDRYGEFLFGLRFYERIHHDPPPVPEYAILSLAVAEEMMRAGGTGTAVIRLDRERHALREWQSVCSVRGLSGPEAQRYSDFMDALAPHRPPIQDAIKTQFLMHRLRVIRVLRSHSDPDCVLAEGPSWRSFFLWRIFIAQTLASLDRLYRELEGIFDLPAKNRAKKAGQILGAAKNLTQVSFLAPETEALPNILTAEAENLAEWTLMRTATALAGYRAETGHFPQFLEELVPRYLPTAAPDLEYTPLADGTARLSREGQNPPWRIRRSE